MARTPSPWAPTTSGGPSSETTPDNFLGEYTFNDGIATGNEVADFLLGYYGGANGFLPGPFEPSELEPATCTITNSATMPRSSRTTGRLTDKLTLNLGLRWDIRPIPYDRPAIASAGWITNNPLGGLCFADPKLATDGIAPPGNGYYRYCGANHPGKTELNNFAPRFGGAYRLDPKTVVRAGVGIFWDGIEGREMDDSGDVYPYVSRQNLAQISGQTSYQTTDQLWPNFTGPSPQLRRPERPEYLHCGDHLRKAEESISSPNGRSRWNGNWPGTPRSR